MSDDVAIVDITGRSTSVAQRDLANRNSLQFAP
jgi:hypothetical protein